LTGEIEVPKNLIEAYDARAKELDDEDFKKVEVEPVDVKSI